MEELQSTEILDHEILEDARKKAHKILKTADDTIKAKSAEWEKKTAKTLGEMEEKYARQGANARDEIMTGLPLDKRRAKARKIEELINSAVAAWYAGLSRQRVLDLIQHELEKRLAACEFTVDGSARALIHKIEKAEAESILRAVLPGIPCTIEEIHSPAAYPELIVETAALRVYASIGREVDNILDVKRAEMTAALLGTLSGGDQELN